MPRRPIIRGDPIGLEAVEAEVVDADPAVQVTGPAFLDSRSPEPGGLFVALAGEHVDGHDYVPQAIAAGAAAVLAGRDVDAPAVVVDDVQTALGRLARHVRGELEGLHVVGITGAPGVGKSTTTDALVRALRAKG